MDPRLNGRWIWIFEDAPPADLTGLIPLVRAANGSGTKTNTGFDDAANYQRWTQALGRPLPAWTWLYPTSDPILAARALHGAAPDAGVYVADVENRLAPGGFAAFCGELRNLAPGCLIGFTSYPTKTQAVRFGVPFDDCRTFSDFAMPQVYFPEQIAALPTVIQDHLPLPVIVTLSPGDAPSQWLGVAQAALGSYGAVSVWRHPMNTAQAQTLAPPVVDVPLPDPVPVPAPHPQPSTLGVSDVSSQLIYLVADGPSAGEQVYNFGSGLVHIDGPTSAALQAAGALLVKVSGGVFAKLAVTE